MATPTHSSGAYPLATSGLSQAANVPSDAEEAHALNAVFDDTEAEAALDALGAKLNAALDALKAAGLMEAD